MSVEHYFALGALMPMDGANNSVVFPDVNAYTRHVFTPNGTARLSTAQSKFRSASLYLDGSASGSYLSHNETPAWPEGLLQGEGDFWFEAWVRPDDFATQRTILGSIHEFNTENISLYFNTAGRLNFAYTNIVRCAGTTSAATGTWSHVAFGRRGDEVKMYLNGVQEGSTWIKGDPFLRIKRIQIGTPIENIGVNSTNKFKGYIAEMRFYRSVSLHNANFTPPGMLDTDVPPYYGFAVSPVAPVLFAYSVPTISYKMAPPALNLVDRVWGGNGVISGTVKVESDPVDTPVARRVRLFNEHDGALVRDIWSDAATGAYSFPNINAALKYTVLTYDYSHNFRAVVADNITPDIMP